VREEQHMCLAIPGKIVSAEGEALERTGRVDFGGVTREINLAYVPEAAIGEYVIVHAGFAISRMDEDEARETLDYLRQIEEFAEIGAPSG
jgi:hydrogenase expression/formation protein HypC